MPLAAVGRGRGSRLGSPATMALVDEGAGPAATFFFAGGVGALTCLSPSDPAVATTTALLVSVGSSGGRSLSLDEGRRGQ